MQRLRDANDRLNAGITDAALDATDVGAIKVGLLSKFVLGKPPLVAYSSDILAERNEDPILCWHFLHDVQDDAISSVDYRLQCSSRDPPFAKFRGAEAESLGEFRNVLDAGIPQPAFDAGDVGGIEPGFLSQLLLRQVARLTAAADVLPEGGKDGVTFRHD